MENVNEKVVFYKRELSFDSIKDIFDKHDFEYVYHFAAYAAEGLSPFMRMFNDKNNMLYWSQELARGHDTSARHALQTA